MRCYYPPVSLYSKRAWMCTCLCMRLFVFVCLFMRACECACVCVHACIYVSVSVSVSVYLYACAREKGRERKREKERERESNQFRQDRLMATGVASSFMYACSTVFWNFAAPRVCMCAKPCCGLRRALPVEEG